jgi:hypothetical protein
MSEELENIIKTHSGYIVIQITESYYFLEQEIERFRNKIEKKFEDTQISFIKINYSEHKDWTKKYMIYGSPAVLIFKDGDLFFRFFGRFNPDEILEKINII